MHGTADPTATAARAPGGRDPRFAAGASSHVYAVLMVAGIFCLYMATAVVLEARNATTHFGADSWYYSELAKGNILAEIKNSYNLDRVARFHPTTVLLAAVWMQVLDPLTRWITPLFLLKSMFAVAGSVGAWAALSAFATIVPRRQAMILSLIYATSFGVWYFASFEESKIITATLSTLYIAIYLGIRSTPTARGLFFLTATLLLACLNEMISGFLVIIPVVDVLVRRGWTWSNDRWMIVHVLVIPIAFIIIEGAMFGRVVAASHPEGTSHVGMLFAYIARNEYNWEISYSFLCNWLFFNLAAPSPDASFGVPVGANYKGHFYKGYFEPSLLNYFRFPASSGVAILFCTLCMAVIIPRCRPKFTTDNSVRPIVLALLAFTFLRAAFFFVFNPSEALLFSAAATLPHLLLMAIPFAAARLPGKVVILGCFAGLLFLANGAFMIGP